MQNEISYSQSQNANDHDNSSASRGRHSSDNPELALFSLIADPQIIAGGKTSPHNTKRDDADQELSLLREALHAREQELAALRRQSPPSASDTIESTPSSLPNGASFPGPSPTLAPGTNEQPDEDGDPGERKLLDAAQAHGMAQEARRSEQASRRALRSAQQAAEHEQGKEDVANWLSPGAALPPSGDRSVNEQSWETRPLSVQKHLLETAPGVVARSGILPDEARIAKSPATAPDVQPQRRNSDIRVRAARAEIRELEATLSLARDTALTQKLEIARLRSQLEESTENGAAEMAALEEAFRSVLPEEESIDVEAIRIEAQNALRAELAQENKTVQEEIERLRARVALGEQEMEAREAERGVLKETLLARETELGNLRLELNQATLQAREEGAHIQKLDAALAKEREQNAETQALLAQLRGALQQEPVEESSTTQRGDRERSPSRPESTAALGLIATKEARREPSRDTHVDGDSIHITPPLNVVHERFPRASQDGPADLCKDSCKTDTATSGRCFEAWQDDQVRRHFGPFGIDTSRDLVTAPLHRRHSSPDHPAKILVLGSDSDAWTERLAEDLIGNESPPFEILRSTTATSVRRTSLQDRPIEEFLKTIPQPNSAADLEVLLEDTRPSVIVSRNFLSQEADVGPWLDVLRQLPRMGPAIVLLESTGIGPISPADALVELGDRIWSLMPARYTRADAQTDQRLESWQEAFQQIQPLPSNGLRAALRDGFDLEISAQFGFLAEPFLRSRIADNFDPKAQRDRRFLHQIADLDDRKIEAGLAPALHFVARIDGRIDD